MAFQNATTFQPPAFQTVYLGYKNMSFQCGPFQTPAFQAICVVCPEWFDVDLADSVWADESAAVSAWADAASVTHTWTDIPRC